MTTARSPFAMVKARPAEPPIARPLAGSAATALVLLAVALQPASAAAHEHGVGQLEVAVDGPVLTILLRVPLDSLLGFERTPRSARERAQVATMARRLAQPEAVLVPSPAADCQPEPVALQSVLIDPALLTVPAGVDTPGTAPVSRSGLSRSKPAHDDLTARYVFRCAKPQALKSLELTLFTRFSRLRQIQAAVVNAQGQSGMRLTPSRPRLSW